MDREHWQRLLTDEEALRGYDDGFKLLFCPWRLLRTSDSLFLSLNPGNDPSGELMRVASDERGNSYLVQREARHSPIAEQYRKLCDLVGQDPEEMLAGTLMPYRTANWSRRRDAPNIEVVADFWQSVLSNGRIRNVYCMGKDVEKAVVEMVAGRLDCELPAGWGKLMVRRYRTVEGIRIFGLLHFSTFKMLSRPACVEQLRELFELKDWPAT